LQKINDIPFKDNATYERAILLHQRVHEQFQSLVTTLEKIKKTPLMFCLFQATAISDRVRKMFSQPGISLVTLSMSLLAQKEFNQQVSMSNYLDVSFRTSLPRRVFDAVDEEGKCGQFFDTFFFDCENVKEGDIVKTNFGSPMCILRVEIPTKATYKVIKIHTQGIDF